jgi:hypothetical protein
VAPKLSEQHDRIAAFYEGVIAHLDDHDGIFLGGPVLRVAEKKQIQTKLKRLLDEHRDAAIQYGADGR